MTHTRRHDREREKQPEVATQMLDLTRIASKKTEIRRAHVPPYRPPRGFHATVRMEDKGKYDRLDKHPAQSTAPHYQIPREVGQSVEKNDRTDQNDGICRGGVGHKTVRSKTCWLRERANGGWALPRPATRGTRSPDESLHSTHGCPTLTALSSRNYRSTYHLVVGQPCGSWVCGCLEASPGKCKGSALQDRRRRRKMTAPGERCWS